ncbi:LysR family transcriptional regulator [Burkholderia sp. Bp9126]|nr:LysR family transcriptional regulator [Burkholderia sp. Bp9126]
MKLPPLGALRAFEAAARLLSLSRAGDELHVTHAAISHQVRNLEAWFGASLFRREGRGIQLTPAGQALFSCVSPLFEAMADACQRVKSMSGAGSLVVGCIPSIAARWLVPNLANFAARHADVDIRVMYAQANDRLSSADLDILITYGEDDTRGVVAERLFSRINMPVCSPHFLREHGPFESASRIASSPMLHDETRDGWSEWCEAAGLQDAGMLPGPVYQDFNLLATAAIAGHGIALCPVNVFRAEIMRGDLVVISDVATNEDRGYFVMTREDRTRIADEFVKWFLAIAQEGHLFGQ